MFIFQLDQMKKYFRRIFEGYKRSRDYGLESLKGLIEEDRLDVLDRWFCILAESESHQESYDKISKSISEKSIVRELQLKILRQGFLAKLFNHSEEQKNRLIQALVSDCSEANIQRVVKPCVSHALAWDCGGEVQCNELNEYSLLVYRNTLNELLFLDEIDTEQKSQHSQEVLGRFLEHDKRCYKMLFEALQCIYQQSLSYFFTLKLDSILYSPDDRLDLGSDWYEDKDKQDDPSKDEVPKVQLRSVVPKKTTNDMANVMSQEDIDSLLSPHPMDWDEENQMWIEPEKDGKSQSNIIRADFGGKDKK